MCVSLSLTDSLLDLVCREKRYADRFKVRPYRLSLPTFERFFVHGANDISTWKRGTRRFKAGLDGLLPCAQNIPVLGLFERKGVCCQHMAEPNTFSRCQLVRSWCVMTTAEGDEDELPTVLVNVPSIVF